MRFSILCPSILAILALSAGSVSAGQTAANAAYKPTIDPQAIKLLDQNQAMLKSIHSLDVIDTEYTAYPPDWIQKKSRQFGMQNTVLLQRPNFAHEEKADLKLDHKTGIWKAQSAFMTFNSNGDKNIRDFGGAYDSEADKPNGENIDVMAESLFGFFDSENSISSQVKSMIKSRELISAIAAGSEDWNGTAYQTVVLKYYTDYNWGTKTLAHVPGGRMVETQKFFIGRDMLIHRSEIDYNVGWTSAENVDYRKIDQPISRIAFVYTVPKDEKPRTDTEPPVLANGSVAPDFTVHDVNGNPIRLSDYKGKVVVLDFWATWCGPCQEAMPGTNKVAEQFSGKNVVFLAVNTSDSEEAFKAWLPTHKNYDALQFAIDPADPEKNIASTQYKVTGIPTQFVIDTNGKVAWSLVGYDDSTDGLTKAIITAQTTP